MAKSPDAFRTIGEVSEWLDTPTHVIRFWESRFDEINPVQKDGGRRYFRPSDLQIMGGLKKLLHEDGLTIKAVQNMIAENGVQVVKDLSAPLPDAEPIEEANSEPDDAADDKPAPLDLSGLEAADPPPALTSSEPVQKPMLLVPAGEILEPNHKWHLKVDEIASEDEVGAAITKLIELRDRLSAIIANANRNQEIQD